jgi:hypothetical protein
VENPELLIGIPLAIVGMVGLLVAVETLVGANDDSRTSTPPGTTLGWQAFIAIAWLTIVEYILAIATGYNVPVLFAIAIFKVLLIGIVFMHANRVRDPEED